MLALALAAALLTPQSSASADEALLPPVQYTPDPYSKEDVGQVRLPSTSSACLTKVAITLYADLLKDGGPGVYTVGIIGVGSSGVARATAAHLRGGDELSVYSVSSPKILDCAGGSDCQISIASMFQVSDVQLAAAEQAGMDLKIDFDRPGCSWTVQLDATGFRALAKWAASVSAKIKLD